MYVSMFGGGFGGKRDFRVGAWGLLRDRDMVFEL